MGSFLSAASPDPFFLCCLAQSKIFDSIELNNILGCERANGESDNSKRGPSPSFPWNLPSNAFGVRVESVETHGMP